nr:MAG TPA: hypothetical protein [Caudoviricetes sp.]
MLNLIFIYYQVLLYKSTKNTIFFDKSLKDINFVLYFTKLTL